MEMSMERKPKIRRGKKKKFIVEANVDAIQWPQECAACGKPVEIYDDNEDASGSFMNMYKVIPPKVPYCQTCYARVKATKRLDTAVLFLGVIFGIPLGILLAYSFFLTLEKISKTDIMCLGLIGAIGFVVGVNIIKFLIRGPIKSIFKNRFTGYVEFDHNSVKISDNNSVWNLEIMIPNKIYATKFATLNSVEPKV
jgi:hypothetical protein